MTNSQIYPHLPMHLIQSIRLIHALAESEYKVCIAPEHLESLQQLIEVFGVSFCTDVKNCRKIEGLSISHSEPRASVGSLHRVLIFPHAIFDRCLGMWKNERSIKYSFAGLITEKRHIVLQKWLSQVSPEAEPLPMHLKPNRFAGFIAKALRKIGLSPDNSQVSTRTQVGDLLIWSSNRGRSGPYKAWDEEYYHLLADSSFVICPSGDFIWTYRFFEAIMCGAIPIVEEPCSAYEGFYFYSMQQPVSTYQWSMEKAQANYTLCREGLTLSPSELNEELQKLLATEP